jgi:hypothetical protein
MHAFESSIYIAFQRLMLGSTISKFLKLDTLLDHLTGYVETKVEIIKLEARQGVAAGLAGAITYLIIAFVAGMFLMFLSLGIAVILAARLGPLAGYGIVAAVYLVALVVLYAKRKKLISNFENTLSENLKRKK